MKAKVAKVAKVAKAATMPPAHSAAELIPPDIKRLAKSASQKNERGEKLTGAETAALRKIEMLLEEKRRWDYYQTIPIKHWRAMSGRQHAPLVEFQARYGIPCGEAVISLPRVVRAMHDWFARNGAAVLRLSAATLDAEDPLVSGGPMSPALEQLRTAKARIAELELDRMRGSLLPVADVREQFMAFATQLRRVGEGIQREFGQRGADFWQRAMTEIEGRFFGDVPLEIDGPSSECEQHESRT